MVILCGLAKAIVSHSLTGLNITIFHDGLFDISYYHYNQYEKLENNYKTYTHAHMLGPHPPVRFCSLFNDPHPPPLLNERTF